MNPRIYTYELYEHDCVGNDLAKHNFNFLNLESKICNIYTDYFDDASSYVRQVSAFMDKLKELKKFEDLTKYHNIYSTVRLLSSYWNKHEFSVLLPNNTQKNKPVVIPVVTSSVYQLAALAREYILKEFKPKSFTVGTKLHVTVMSYNNAFNSNTDNLLTTTFNFPDRGAATAFSHYKRLQDITYTRRDTHFSKSQIFSFYNTGDDWYHFNCTGGSVTAAAVTGRTSLKIKIQKNSENVDIGALARAQAAYVAGKTDVVIEISPEIYVGSKDYRQASLIISNLSAGDTAVLFNYGTIVGAGGPGGEGGNSMLNDTKGKPGYRGGPAIAAFVPTIIENYGEIYGGGGGGAGGTGRLSGANSTGGGGGGGAGRSPGRGGLRGSNPTLKEKNIMVYDGTTGGFSKGANGGIGLLNYDIQAIGGKGGDLGLPGNSTVDAAGGRPGYYLLGDSNVFWSVRGKTLGDAI